MTRRETENVRTGTLTTSSIFQLLTWYSFDRMLRFSEKTFVLHFPFSSITISRVPSGSVKQSVNSFLVDLCWLVFYLMTKCFSVYFRQGFVSFGLCFWYTCESKPWRQTTLVSDKWSIGISGYWGIYVWLKIYHSVPAISVTFPNICYSFQ